MSAAAENFSVENNSENKIENGNSELAQMVKESTANIQQQKIVPPKRGPGRPPGTGKNQTASQMHSGPSVVPKSEPVPPPDLSEYLIPPLITLSNIPANRHKIPELALNPNEAAAVAHSLQGILNAFVPDLSVMSPKTAAVLSAGITIGTITMQKMQIYSQKKMEQFEEAQKAAAAEPPPSATQPFPINDGGGNSLFKNLTP